MAKVKIIAETVEEFNELKRAYDELPLGVKNGIYSVEKEPCGYTAKLKRATEARVILVAPSDIKEIVIEKNGAKIITTEWMFHYNHEIFGAVVVSTIKMKG